MVSTITFGKESVLGGRSSATPGSRASKTTGPSIRIWPIEWYRMQHRQLPDGWDKELPVFPADAKGMATRVSSGQVLNEVAKRCLG